MSLLTWPAPLTELRAPPVPYLAVPYPAAYRTINSVPIGYVGRPGYVVYPPLQPWLGPGRVPQLYGWQWHVGGGARASSSSRASSSTTVNIRT